MFSGKRSAALVMARFGMAVRLLASQARGPVDLLVTLNILLLMNSIGHVRDGQALALDPAAASLKWSMRGTPHRCCALQMAESRSLRSNPARRSERIREPRFEGSRRVLEAGETLVLYTDGLSEAETTPACSSASNP